jgi:lipid-binding SYLF domain-containing protein
MKLLIRPIFILATICSILLSKPGFAITEQEEMVQKAHISVQKILQNDRIGASVKDALRQAKGVLIFPNLYKGALFFGAEGGSGVLMAKGSGNRWSYPAFYFMGSGSFGLQIGAQSAEVMLIIMTERGLNAILKQKVKLGADVNAAIGPYGVGAKAGTTVNLGADILTYSINQGVFAGFSFMGAVIYPRSEFTAKYYGDNAAVAQSVVIDGRFRNPQAEILRDGLFLPPN